MRIGRVLRARRPHKPEAIKAAGGASWMPPFNTIQEVYLPTSSETTGISKVSQMALSNIFGPMSSRLRIENTRASRAVAEGFARLHSRPVVKNGRVVLDHGRPGDYWKLPYPYGSTRGRMLTETEQQVRSADLMIVYQVAVDEYAPFVAKKLESQLPQDVVIRELAGQELLACIWAQGEAGQKPSADAAESERPIDVFEFWRLLTDVQQDEYEDLNPSHAESLLSRLPSALSGVDMSSMSSPRYLLTLQPSNVGISTVKAAMSVDSSEAQIVAVGLSGPLLGGSSGLVAAVSHIEKPWKYSDPHDGATGLADILKELARVNLTSASIGPGGRLFLAEESHGEPGSHAG